MADSHLHNMCCHRNTSDPLRNSFAWSCPRLTHRIWSGLTGRRHDALVAGIAK